MTVEHKSNRDNSRAPKAFHGLSGPCCSFTTVPEGHHATGESSAPIDLPCADQPIRFTLYVFNIAYTSSNACSFLVVTDTTLAVAQIDKDGSINVGVDRCTTRTIMGVMITAFLLAGLVEPHSRTNTYGMLDNRGCHRPSLNVVGSTNFHRGVASSRTRSYRSGSSLR